MPGNPWGNRRYSRESHQVTAVMAVRRDFRAILGARNILGNRESGAASRSFFGTRSGTIWELTASISTYFRTQRSTAATEMPMSRVPSTNHFAIGIPTTASSTKPRATRMPVNSASVCITRNGPGCRAGSRCFMSSLSRCARRKASRLRKLEIDRDARLEVGGLAVVPVGLVAPLLYRALRRLP